MGSCHSNDLGGAEYIEAIDEGDADLDFSGLVIGVSCGDAFTNDFEAAHPLVGSALRSNVTRGFASGVLSGPALPECPAVVPDSTQSFVSGDCSLAVRFPRAPVLADRHDRIGLALNNGGIATARVIGTASSHRLDFLAAGDLFEQVRQRGAITISAGPMSWGFF